MGAGVRCGLDLRLVADLVQLSSCNPRRVLAGEVQIVANVPGLREVGAEGAKLGQDEILVGTQLEIRSVGLPSGSRSA